MGFFDKAAVFFPAIHLVKVWGPVQFGYFIIHGILTPIKHVKTNNTRQTFWVQEMSPLILVDDSYYQQPRDAFSLKPMAQGHGWEIWNIIYIPYTVHTYYVLIIHSYDILYGIDVFWLWQGRQLRPMTNTIFGTSGKITEAHQDPNYRMCNLSFSNLDYWASAILRHSIQHSFTQHFR